MAVFEVIQENSLGAGDLLSITSNLSPFDEYIVETDLIDDRDIGLKCYLLYRLRVERPNGQTVTCWGQAVPVFYTEQYVRLVRPFEPPVGQSHELFVSVPPTRYTRTPTDFEFFRRIS